MTLRNSRPGALFRPGPGASTGRIYQAASHFGDRLLADNNVAYKLDILTLEGVFGFLCCSAAGVEARRTGSSEGHEGVRDGMVCSLHQSGRVLGRAARFTFKAEVVGYAA